MALKNKKNILHTSNFCSVKKSVVSWDKKLKKNNSKKSIFRIIDANLNRCREGLRVVEDSLRFILDDKILYKNIRSIRHGIDKILRNKYGELIKERDSIEDSGRQILETTAKELPAVIIANFKRAEESLRVLEEYSKVFVPETSADFKKQRYLTYTTEKKVYMKYKNFLDKNNE
jgi:thiamine-phosphate pyrophosphorylase